MLTFQPTDERQNDSPKAESSAVNAAARQRTHIRPHTGWLSVRPIASLAEVWRHRDLLRMFAIRDVKVRYKQTFFGYAWAVVVPLVQVVVFTFIFGNVLGVSDKVTENYGRALPYALFILTGQIVWNFFKTAVDGAGGSLLNNAGIIRKIYVPRLVLPISALAKPALDSAVVFVLMIGFTLWYGFSDEFDVRLTPTLLLAPLLLLATAIPALAVGLFSAALTVNYRDLVHVLPFAFGILFYLTPVILPVSLLPEDLQWILLLNPVTGFVEAHRASVMGLPISWATLAISLGFSLSLLAAGLVYFIKAERQFADVA